MHPVHVLGVVGFCLLIVRDGAFVDSVGAHGGGPEWDEVPLAAAGERPGTYGVTVRREGYRPTGLSATRGSWRFKKLVHAAAVKLFSGTGAAPRA